MSQRKRRTYVPVPKAPARVQPRYEAVMKVLAGTSTVAGAARELELSRNHFQTLLHRAMQAVIQATRPRRGGRPRKPEAERRLEAERDRLRRENRRLRERLAMTDHLLEAVSDTMTGKVPMRRSPSRPRTAGRADAPDAVDEPPEGPAEKLVRDDEMKTLRIVAPVRAALLGVGCSTLRRWRAEGAPEAMRARRSIPIAAEREAQAKELIRSLNGRIGATALSKAVVGVSRRAAGRLVREMRATLERERKARMQQVLVTHPGVVRGFDAMELGRGKAHVLVSTDAAVPFRTSIQLVGRYDSAAVCCALRADFEKNGAPLVLRMDRASQHRTEEVDRLLASYGVIVLHGPARYPRYYGQLERQNREHREWLGDGEIGDDAEAEAKLAAMAAALNGALPRRKLGWRTAESAWSSRAPLALDREGFKSRVDAEHERVRRESPELEHLHVRRMAIERALIEHGLLKIGRPEGAR